MNGSEALNSVRCALSLCPNHDYKKENDTCDIIEKELKASEVVGKHLDIKFERTSAGRPIMLVRSKTLGQSWLIHISEEEFNLVKGESK